jgi:hypothetical protein
MKHAPEHERLRGRDDDALENQDYHQRTVHGRACFRIIYNSLNQSWASHATEVPR